jgi:hypothetical protein
MRRRRIGITRAHVTITVTLTLYGWLALNSPLTRQAMCGARPSAVQAEHVSRGGGPTSTLSTIAR